MIGASVGLVAGAGTAFLGPWQIAVLTGWDLTAIVITGSIWWFIPVLDCALTRSTARREDPSAANDDFVVLIASLVSYVLGTVIVGVTINVVAGLIR